MKKIISFKKGTFSFWNRDRLEVGQINSENERRGGGLFLLGQTDQNITGRIFILNGSVKDGGGIYLNRCKNITIDNCVFILNIAKWGGGIYLEQCEDIRITNNLFCGNIAGRDGGAIAISNCNKVYLTKNKLWLNLSFRSNRNIDILKSKSVVIVGPLPS